MKRKTTKALKLTAHHATIALNMLVEEGKIAAGDIARALKRREKVIKELRAKLSALEEASAPVARRMVAAGRKAVRKAVRSAEPRARKAISNAQKAARQAQGRYMAAVRRLSEEARVKIREIRKESGVDAAIKAALKMPK